MGVFNGVFPIQSGKEEDARAFAAETFGARRQDFEAHMARGGNTRETDAAADPHGQLHSAARELQLVDTVLGESRRTPRSRATAGRRRRGGRYRRRSGP